MDFVSSYYDPSLPTYSGCRGFLLHLIILLVTNTYGRSLWTSDQAVGRSLPDTTRHLQQTHTHAPGGIRTCNPTKRAAADSLRCHRDSALLLNCELEMIIKEVVVAHVKYPYVLLGCE